MIVSRSAVEKFVTTPDDFTPYRHAFRAAIGTCNGLNSNASRCSWVGVAVVLQRLSSGDRGDHVGVRHVGCLGSKRNPHLLHMLDDVARTLETHQRVVAEIALVRLADMEEVLLGKPERETAEPVVSRLQCCYARERPAGAAVELVANRCLIGLEVDR